MYNALKKETGLIRACLNITYKDRLDDFWIFGLITLSFILNVVLTILFFKIIYLRTNSIGGWSLNEVYVLIGTYEIVVNIGWSSFVRGYNKLGRRIEDGYLDVWLTKPLSLRRFFVYQHADIFFTPLLVIINCFVVAYGVVQSGLNFNLPIYLVCLLLSVLIFYSIVSIVATINFFILIPRTYMMINQIVQLGRYPITVYKGVFRFILSLVVPVALMISLPAQALFGKVHVIELVIFLMVTIVLLLVSSLFWHIGLKRYTSANG